MKGLLKSERMLAEFFKNSVVGLALFDEHGRYQMVNPYLAASNGTSIESHLGKNLREILGDVGLQVEPAIRQVFATAQPVLNHKVAGAFPTKPAGGHWIDSFFPVVDSSGTVGWVGAVVVELDADLDVVPVCEVSSAAVPILRSWKDIAHYMGTCVKTVQRWERAYELPVRRVHPNKGSIVLAYRDELDEWLRRHAAFRKSGPAISD